MKTTAERTKHPGIYRRGGSYSAVVTYRDSFGRKRQKWIAAKTLRAAQDARRNLLNELERGLRPDGSRMTVEEFALGRFLPDAEDRLRPLTVRQYRGMLLVHVLPAIGQVKLRDVTGERLLTLYRTLPTPSLRLQAHNTLSALLTFAVRDAHVLSGNPCSTIRPPKYKAPEARHMDSAESKRMLEAAVGTSVEGGILLGLAGGLRIAEVVALQWGDVEDDVVTVRRSYWGETKSGRIRSLTLPTFAAAALKRCKVAQARSLLAVGVAQGKETHIMSDAVGRPLPLRTFRDMFNAFCAQHGFGMTFHALRHSNAIALLTSGVDVKTAAGRLGNSPALMLKTYAHFVRSADKAAAKQLGAAFS